MNMRDRGFSLVEFMIAITISTIILAALTATFVSNSRARLEIDRANQQIENGRYAVMALSDDLQLAGFHSTYYILNDPTITVPSTKGSPCETDPAALAQRLYIHVQGYDAPDLTSTAHVPTCNDAGGNNLLADYKPGTDIVVVRRAATCVQGSANCPPQTGAPHFQASLCQAQLNTTGGLFRMALLPSTPPGSDFTRLARDCVNPAPIRQWIVHVYYITNNDAAGDGMPTLKRAELGSNGFTAISLANGIENLQLEYGLDWQGATAADPPDGRPDGFTADPDRYDAPNGDTGPFVDCADNTFSSGTLTGCTYNWANTVSAKVTLLARNPFPTRDYTDTKVYTLGLTFAGAPQCAKSDAGGCVAYNDQYKRHVYQSAVRLNNAAGRRE